MKYTIPIVPEVTLENAAIAYGHYYRETLRRSSFWMFVVLVIAFIGYALPFPDTISIITAAIGLAAAFVFVFYAAWISIQKKKYLSEIKKMYSEPGEMTIELTEDHFIYADHQQQSKLQWDLFDSYFISEGILFLTCKNGTGYMISPKLTPETDLRDIIAFVKGKVPPEKKK